MKLIDQRNEIRGSFAATRFGGRDQIASRHRNWNGAGLNWGGLMMAAVFD
jgi:hypothetical protein